MEIRLLNKPGHMPVLGAVSFSVMCAVVLATFYNDALWQVFFTNTSLSNTGDYAFSVFAFIALSCWLCIFLLLASLFNLSRPFTIVVFVAAALVSYFSSEYGIVVNKSMIRNALEASSDEVFELLNLKMALYMLVYGLVPAIIIMAIPIQRLPIRQELPRRVLAVVATAVLLVGSLLIFNKEFTFLIRQHTVMRSLVNPVYPISALAKVIVHEPKVTPMVQTLAMDAQRKVSLETHKPMLFVVVVGETARAKNFSINGYPRKTNPLLAEKDILSFKNTLSCGTSTAESLPCMFSHLGRSDFSTVGFRNVENLLDIFKRVGIETHWLDNNTGCKAVCNRIPTKATWNIKHAELCSTDECFDEILLHELKQHRDKPSNKDTLIVLHQKGSHGPAYYKRVPESFNQFKPGCQLVSLQDCDRQEVINSYDNTILYTDYVLAKLIDYLQEQSEHYRTGMIYMSDHGESLGEMGLYLHGMPYFIAPTEQIHVPNIHWYSDGLLEQANIDRSCLNVLQSGSYSHDNLFHTLLGIMHVQTSEYQQQLDILGPCRPSGTQHRVILSRNEY